MSEPANTESAAIDEHARVAVPGHVVYRTFVTETVALNIESGQYHGLNATAGRMLEEIEKRGTVAAAVEPLAGEFEQPPERIRADLLALCASLHARGLIEIG
jgi:Coenzyme PQQ synthesis protein D (PqqD)